MANFQSIMKLIIYCPRFPRIAIAAGVLCASLSSASGQAVNDPEAGDQEAWREAIVQTEVPAEGCFHASYPSLTWEAVECAVAPDVLFLPRRGGISQTVGNGNDYAAQVASGTLISTSIGSFPTVTGVKTETGTLGANDYSLQLNSNFVTNSAACNGAGSPAACIIWEQFVYASGYETAFMQYWLLNWNNPCPDGWTGYSNCVMNSAAVTVLQESVTDLSKLKLSGSAVEGGMDTLVLTVGTEAYSTTGSDSVLDLATAWTESEFNILGDGNGSAATFNSGSSVTVKVAVSNGTEDAPTCASDAGTSAETNNLNLGSCSSTGGTKPYIEFTESNPLLPQTITFSENAPATSAYDTSFGVAATASSGLIVEFSKTGVCSVVDNGNGTATYTMTAGSGTCSVIAKQPGNSSYAPAPTITQSVSASQVSQTISFTVPPPSNAPYKSRFTVKANATSGLHVTFTSSGSCTNSGGTYTIVASTGTCSVIVNQPGNGDYAPAPTLTQIVNASLTVTTPTLPTATVGTPYSAAIGISGGTPPYTFSWSGTLPAGLYFYSFATLSGTPTVGGIYSFTVTVSDSSNPVQTVTQTVSITVEPVTVLTITTTSLPNGQLGTAYSASVQATGGCPPYKWSVTQLPAGLTLNSTSGVISGTPSASGLFGFTITATDTCSDLAAESYNISISNPSSVGSGTLTMQLTPNGYQLTAVSCVPNSQQVSCWAVGAADAWSTPIILYSGDAGQTWSSETPPSGLSGPLYSINCPALNVCYAGTNTGGSLVIMTTDGTNWTALSTPSGSPGGGSVSCPNTSTCFVTGGDSLGTQAIMYTTNSGSSWTIIPTCAFCSGSVTGSTEFQEQGISCPTTLICYASGTATSSGVGTAAVLSTTDGGTTWGVTTLAGSDQLLDITCTSSTQCWLVGEPDSAAPYDYPYVASTSDGSDWQVYGTPLTGYGPGGILIGGVACVSASSCMVTDVQVTQAYSTNNGGTGWLTYALPSGAGSLAGTSCVSSGECWLVTQGGGIFATLLSPQ
jgi:hypothetical protein